MAGNRSRRPIDASRVPVEVTTAGDWSSPPERVTPALDELAGRTSTVEAFTKSGQVLAGAFSGDPLTSSVVFGTAFSDDSFDVILTTEVSDSASAFVPVYLNKAAAGFDISLVSNNSSGLISIAWSARKRGS